MNYAKLFYACLAFVAVLGGCGPSVQLTLPEQFVLLEPNQNAGPTGYRERGTTPDGVVVGVRVLEHRVRGTLPFWCEAIVRRLRDQEGYAVLSEQPIEAQNGQPGRLVRFGRDLDGHGYRYTIAVFVTDSHLFIVDGGGREETYAALEPAIERSIADLTF